MQDWIVHWIFHPRFATRSQQSWHCKFEFVNDVLLQRSVICSPATKPIFIPCTLLFLPTCRTFSRRFHSRVVGFFLINCPRVPPQLHWDPLFTEQNESTTLLFLCVYFYLPLVFSVGFAAQREWKVWAIWSRPGCHPSPSTSFLACLVTRRRGFCSWLLPFCASS